MRKIYLLVCVVFAAVANGQVKYSSFAATGVADINASEKNARGPHVNANTAFRSTAIGSGYFQSNSGNTSDNNTRTFACDPPTSITVSLTSSTTALVSFVSAGTNFIVEYGPTGFTPGTGATPGTNGIIVTGTNSPIFLAGLTSATTYDLYMRQVCDGPTYGDNSTPAVTFTTLCDPVNVPYTEKFDGATAPNPPACISVTNNNSDASQWVTDTRDAASAPNSMYIEWNPSLAMNDWFFTRGLNLNGGTAYRLTFKYKTGDLDNHEKLKVMFGTGPSAGFMTTVIRDFPDIYQPTGYVTETWDFVPPAPGIYYIGFQGYSDANRYYIVIDDISVNVVPACAPPTSISIVPTGPAAASVSFISGGNNYIVEYGAPGFTPGTDGNPGTGGTIVTGTSSPVDLTGMTGGPAYDVYIRQNCGGGSYGTNSPVSSFVVNDEAVGAVTLTVGAPCTGANYTNLNATKSPNEAYPSCSGTATAPVWFKFTAPTSGAVRISTDVGTEGIFDDSKIGLFTVGNPSDYSTFEIKSCDDDGGTALGLGYRSVIYATGLSGDYYIAVDKYDEFTSSGAFCITVEELNSSMLATVNDCSPNYQTPSGGNTDYKGWQPLLDLNSNLIALVRNPAGGSVSSYSVSEYINLGGVRTDHQSGQKYLDRNFRINNGAATNIDVQLFFLNSELTALQAADPSVTLGNLGVTRQTSANCEGDFTAANGTNSYIKQTASGLVNGVNWVSFKTPGLSNFFLHTDKAYLPLQVFLQGAMQTGIVGGPFRHKDVTSTWANILNTNALVQPYGTTPYNVAFNYNGAESVSPGFFTSTSDTTDVVDWVLVELRDATNPATIIKRRAAFVREDGRIVDLNGKDSLSFRDVESNNYFVVIRHRNHLPVRSATVRVLDGALGSSAPALYDFTDAQAKAFQSPTTTTNAAMKNFGNGRFAMWGGNVDLSTSVKFTGPPNDAAALLSLLGGNQATILNSQYNRADVDMNGTVRFTGPTNDAAALLAFIGGIQSTIINQHQ